MHIQQNSCLQKPINTITLICPLYCTCTCDKSYDCILRPFLWEYCIVDTSWCWLLPTVHWPHHHSQNLGGRSALFLIRGQSFSATQSNHCTSTARELLQNMRDIEHDLRKECFSATSSAILSKPCGILCRECFYCAYSHRPPGLAPNHSQSNAHTPLLKMAMGWTAAPQVLQSNERVVVEEERSMQLYTVEYHPIQGSVRSRRQGISANWDMCQ